MKGSILIPFIFYTISFLSCQQPDTINHILLAEQYVTDSPEKAQAELDSISKDYYSLSLKWRSKYTFTACQVANKLETNLPYWGDIKEAKAWYTKKGSKEEQVKIALFLGRSYRKEKEDDDAMKEYLYAYKIAKEANLYNMLGYICSYIGDLYTDKNDVYSAVSKYKEGADYFCKAGNMRSFSCANRDIGRTYYFLDSVSVAMEYMLRADSVATILDDKRVKSSIYNGFGNLYMSLGAYDKAKNYLLLALHSDTSIISPNYMSLNKLYIIKKEYNKALAMLDSLYLLELPDDYLQNMLYNYYLIYAEKGNPAKALDYFEQYYDIFEKRMVETTDANYIEIEKIHDHVILRTYIQQLTISRQYYLIAFVVSVIIVLFLFILYQNRRIRFNQRLYKKEQELKDVHIRMLDLSLRIDQGKQLLKSMKEKQQDHQVKEAEIDKFKKELQEIRSRKMEQSEVRKRLIRGGQPHKLENRIVLDDKLWISIEKEVTSIYPEFSQKLFVLHPCLSHQDFLYCCLRLFHLETSQEATLLDIHEASVRKRRTRIRENMGVSLVDSDMYTYLVNEVING